MNGLEEKIICGLVGPYESDRLNLGHGSFLKGNVQVGKNVRIGHGTAIVSENSRVVIGDNVEIGNHNTIKHRDNLPENNGLDILIGDGTVIYNNVVLGNGITLGKGCKVSDYVKLGRDVSIGDECILEERADIVKHVIMGNRNKCYGCIIGRAAQGKEHEDEATGVFIGDDNEFRDLVEVNRGSHKGGGLTKIGNKNLVLSHAHIAHDCRIGDDNEIISGTLLAGHVSVGNHVRISGMVGIQQYLHIGDYSFIAGGSDVSGNVLPYSEIKGTPAGFRRFNRGRVERYYGNNAGKVMDELRTAERIIKDNGIRDDEVAERLRELGYDSANAIAGFIESLPEGKKKFLRERHQIA